MRKRRHIKKSKSQKVEKSKSQNRTKANPLRLVSTFRRLDVSTFHGRARGVALLVCIFAMVIVSSLVVLALDVQTTEMSITRNTLSMSKALYAADAGVQHALGMLRADRTWRTGFPSPGVEFPPGSGCYYVVTIADGAGGEVIVTSVGTVGGLSRSIRATMTVAP